MTEPDAVLYACPRSPDPYHIVGCIQNVEASLFCAGPRFEIKDFLVKLGSVTIGGTVKVI